MKRNHRRAVLGLLGSALTLTLLLVTATLPALAGSKANSVAQVSTLVAPGIRLLPRQVRATPTPPRAILQPFQDRSILTLPTGVAPVILTSIAPRPGANIDIFEMPRLLLTPQAPLTECGATLEVGEPAQGQLSGFDDECAFLVEGQPNQTLILRVRPLASGLTLDLAVTDRSRSFIVEANAPNPDGSVTLNLTPGRTDTYLVLVRGNQAGRFEIVVGRPMVPVALALCGDNNLVYGKQVTHRLLDEAEACEYRFNAVAGDSVLITMDKADSSGDPSDLDPFLQLLGPREEFIASDDDGGEADNAQLAFTLTATGRHHILAADRSGDETGPFRLSLSLIPPEGSVSPSPTPTPTR